MAKKASVKITGVSQARDSALKFLSQSVKGKELLNKLGQEAADQIRNRTRGRLEEYRQKEITEVTKAVRQVYLENFGGKGDLSRPKTSNLTLSGQLLDAIKFRVNESAANITIYLEDSRFVNKLTKTRKEIIQATKFGKNKEKNKLLGIAASILADQKPSKSNKEINKDLESRGRKFFFLSPKLNALLESKIADELRRQLSIYNKIKRKLSL